ncbi:DUF4424 family protein [Paragemmobacter ruber]|uniref:DUF4424 domain-containing protein n=1 Tax=Paragemmobacter ruber TaxID=1985673 RepID=A0ABW9Y9D0_9RHOB|nr:DUF4424 family protein [Rhodobacter ruber]NBE09212.1 DUF4424 domain-containing protein [Rhodobacter ruber]
MFRAPAAAFAAALLFPAAVFANDGFGGLSATGLHFAQTDAIAMESEDLFISPDRIRVTYTFRNRTDADVTGEVIFPLPPISLQYLQTSDFNLPEDRENLVNFTATVDGQPVPVTIDRIAVIEPPWVEDRPPAEQYDTPGRDVTAALARHGIPLTLDVAALTDTLNALPAETRAALQAEGLAEFYAGDPAQGMPPETWPLWSIILRYHWTQTFPAGQTLTIAHDYENRPPGGLFYWQHPATEDWATGYAARYCIDDRTSRGIAKRLAPAQGMGVAYSLAYVLRTANSWAGPIGDFRLTLDKGAEENIISLCAEGVEKTGPTTFEIRKRNYSPDRDLDILIVTPLPQ